MDLPNRSLIELRDSELVMKGADWTFVAARASFDYRPLVFVATEKIARGAMRTSSGKKTDLVMTREDHLDNLLLVRPIFSHLSWPNTSTMPLAE